jgi:hypothetical protein
MRPTNTTWADRHNFDLKEQQTFEVPLSTLKPKEVSSFYLGAEIALSNLPCDGDPNKLREEIEELEANTPEVVGESKTRLNGTKWVYQEVKEVLAKDHSGSETIKQWLKDLRSFVKKAQNVSTSRRTAS